MLTKLLQATGFVFVTLVMLIAILTVTVLASAELPSSSNTVRTTVCGPPVEKS